MMTLNLEDRGKQRSVTHTTDEKRKRKRVDQTRPFYYRPFTLESTETPITPRFTAFFMEIDSSSP